MGILWRSCKFQTTINEISKIISPAFRFSLDGYMVMFGFEVFLLALLFQFFLLISFFLKSLMCMTLLYQHKFLPENSLSFQCSLGKVEVLILYTCICVYVCVLKNKTFEIITADAWV